MKFIFGDSGGNIGVYDLAKGKELYNICDQGFINCVAVSPNGQIFASVADNIRLWDVETGREICTLEEKTNVAAVVFAHDGLRLITSSVLIDHIETIQIWDIDTKKVVFQLTREDDTNFSVMGGEIRKEPALYINPERNYIYALGESGQVGLWDLGNDGKYSEIASDAICFTITPDWKRAIVKGSYSLKDIRIHNLLTKKVELEIETGQRGIVGIVLTPDGNRLISAGREDIKIWDLGDGQLIRTFKEL